MTLIELIIALVLLSVIILGLNSITLFSHFHVTSSDRRAKLQNEASLALEHMSKEISKAIGDVNNTPVIIEDSNRRIRIYIDANGDGQRNDYYIAYQYQGSPDYHIRYYPNYPGSSEVIARKISSFNPSYNSVNNYITIQLTACWDPQTAVLPNGSIDNPCVNMNTSIKMPSVSTN